MKTPRIANAVSHIDDDLVNSSAACVRKTNKNAWMKWGSIAACFIVMMVAMVFALPMMFENDSPVVPPDGGTTNDNEYKYESGYFYQVDEGAYSTYVGGKVITEDKVGEKLADVALTAGWKNEKNEWTSTTERLRGEVYVIEGVSTDVAVALKFIDKGEAITTTHYYVIMNPQGDLTPVEDYIITPVTPNTPGEEAAGEVLE